MDASPRILFDFREVNLAEAPPLGETLADADTSLEAVYRQHRDVVMRMLRRRLDNEDDVAELTQEAFLRVLRYRDCGAQSLKPLVLRVALNLAVSHYRLARHQSDVPLGDLDIADDEWAFDEQLVREERMAQMFYAVQALPERCRRVFMLSRIHGVRHREIAERCGISARMVEKHLTRAQRLLRERVREAA